MKKNSIRKSIQKKLALIIAVAMCCQTMQFSVYADEVQDGVEWETEEANSEVVSETDIADTSMEDVEAITEQSSEEYTTTEAATEDNIEVEEEIESTEGDDFIPVNSGMPGKDLPVEAVTDGTNGEIILSEDLPSRFVPALSQAPHATNQGFLGTCYAFATIGAIEANVIKNGASQSSVDYSELALAYFTTNTVTDPLGGTVGDSNSYNPNELMALRNKGYLDDVENGNPCFTAPVLASWTGAQDESLAPYDSTAAATSKKVIVDDSVAFNDVAHVQNWYSVMIKGDPVGLKNLITKCGAATFAYNASGSIRMPDGTVKRQYLGSDGYSYYNHVDTGLNHFVTVIGWDDDYPADKFDYDASRPEGNGAWLVRNSWDETEYKGDSIDDNLGLYQFFWISYYDTSIINGYAFEVEGADNYDHNYQYDMAADYDYCNLKDVMKGANVFTAKACDKGEMLRAVSFQTSGTTNMDYTIRIYRNPKEGDPESGELVESATTSGQTSYCGYYTVKLANPVYIAKGESYSVVVEVSKEGDNVGLSCEYSSKINDPDYWYVSTIGMDEGCSYLYDPTRGWYDMIEDYYQYNGTYGNLKIKAFTDDALDSDIPVAPSVVSANLLGIEVEYKGDETSLKSDDTISLSDIEVTRIVEVTYSDSTSETISETVDTEAEAGNFVLTCDVTHQGDTALMSVTVKYTYNGVDRQKVLNLLLNESATGGKLVIRYNAGVDEYTYTGAAIKPAISVYYNGVPLTEKIDYSVSYKNNINVASDNALKAPTITVTGKGNYKSVVTDTFNIIAKDISDADITANDIAIKTPAKAVKTVPTVKYGKKTLAKNNAGAFAPLKGNPTEAKDMTITYLDASKNVIPEIPAGATGTYYVRVTGTNNYTGTRDITLKASGLLMSSAKVTFYTDTDKSKTTTSYPYTGKSDFDIKKYMKVTVKDQSGTRELGADEYDVETYDNVSVGTKTITIVGKADVIGTKTATFKINGIKIASVAKIKPYEKAAYYNKGLPVEMKPTIVMKSEGAEPLKEGIDYVVSYKNITNAGTATVTVTGINAYTGSLTAKYKILQADIGSLKISADSSVVYTKGGAKANITVKHVSTVLVEGKDYVVTYSNNNKLSTSDKKAGYKIKFKGNYKGTYTGSYDVVRADISSIGSVEASDILSGNNLNKTKLKLIDTNGKALAANTDYNAKALKFYAVTEYDENGNPKIDIKTATELDGTKPAPSGVNDICVLIAGNNNYEGTVTGFFRVVGKDIAKANVRTCAQPYTGEAIEPGYSVFTEITYKDPVTKKNQPLVANKDYIIVGYSNNTKRGVAKVTIRGIGEYGGTKTINFTIGQQTLITRIISIFF